MQPIEAVLAAWQLQVDSFAGDLLAGLPQPVRVSTDGVRAALEDRDHVIKDMSSRPLSFARHPSEEMVHHVERYHTDYAGLVVKSVRSRQAEVLVDDGVPGEEPRLLGSLLIGRTRSPKLVSLLERSAQERQAEEIWRKAELDDEDRKFVVEAAAESLMPNQTVGGSGIEGYFDHELAGRNGFREIGGLEESDDGHAPIFEPPQDGQDLTLTLDIDLQRAAEWVINHPEAPLGQDGRFDPEWYRSPVGAIVVLRPDGELLAAAAAPVIPGPREPHQDGQREVVVNRPMRMPTFQPPGSILKPLVASWALEYLGLNADQPRVLCHWSTHTKKKSGAGWGEVACHSKYGHSSNANAEAGRPDIDLAHAIRVSCNTYFAEVGEHLYGSGDFQPMLAAFGLGERTGILQFGLAGRGGLLEEYAFAELAEYTPIERQRLGNGLSHLSATPLQMARAYAGLATGQLPSVRIARRIGDVEVPYEFRLIPVADYNLAVVRKAMEQVVARDGGSAHNKGLSEAEIGAQLICKTGSADYITTGAKPDWDHWDPSLSMDPEWVEGVRKHTWVAGWLPAGDPKFIVVVYIHDTATTSSHGAVYVMSQFLRDPAGRSTCKRGTGEFLSQQTGAGIADVHLACVGSRWTGTSSSCPCCCSASACCSCPPWTGRRWRSCAGRAVCTSRGTARRCCSPPLVVIMLLRPSWIKRHAALLYSGSIALLVLVMLVGQRAQPCAALDPVAEVRSAAVGARRWG
ncbi:MAG: penicillin-binding transpeptidase domain-containing protein [Planctomycetota bacterium]